MSKQKPNTARAFYRRKILTLDLPSAREPVLWRQAIKNISSLAFSLHTVPEGTALVLRASDSAEQIVAIFDDPAAADDALATLRGIFIQPGRKNIWRKVLKVLAILFVLWLTLRWGVYLGKISEPDKPVTHTAAEGAPTAVPTPTITPGGAATPPSSPSASLPPAETTGVATVPPASTGTGSGSAAVPSGSANEPAPQSPNKGGPSAE